MDIERQEAKNILIVKLSAIGDVVHTLPSLAAMREMCPTAHITWVVEEASADLITDHPALDRLIVFRRKRWIENVRRRENMGGTVSDILKFIRELRERRYDVVIDFHGLFKSSLVVLLSGARRKLGYDSMQELSGLFLNEKIVEDMGKHAVDRYLDFVRYLGGKVGTPEFLIPVTTENKKNIERLLKANNVDMSERFVAVNPVAYWDTKLWDNDKFARLCDRIVTELQHKVVFTGSKDDDTIDHIRKQMTQPAVSVEGRTTLRDLAHLYTLSSALITTDSGPMHIAAAVNTPTVALFGPTDPARTGPYGKGHRVVRKELDCSPCFLKRCATMRCMKEISPDEVFDAVRKTIRTAEGGQT